MATKTLQEQARALGDPTRHAIFTHLGASATPVTIAELTARFPLHHNAIRQHLAKLVAAGLVVERTSAATGPGRPRLVYAVDPAVTGQWGTTGPYERLSRLLVEVIRSGRTPHDVGRGAGAGFRAPHPSGDAVADLSEAMARQGFEPEVRAEARGAEIVLHHCPFAAVALDDRETVCALHLGIAEGIVGAGPARVDELVAYDPRAAECRLRLTVADAAPAPGPADAASAPAGVLTLRRKRRPGSA
jgi:predicted ArsR family transcriptional regulator